MGLYDKIFINYNDALKIIKDEINSINVIFFIKSLVFAIIYFILLD